MTIKRPVRNINLPRALQTQKQAQEKYFIKQVTHHPKFRLILQSLKEGIKATEIAKHFAEHNWLTVNERTFAEAIRVFKNKHPEFIETMKGEGLDALVDPNRPPVDIRQQLQQLLRMQRARLGMAHKFETEAGVINGTLHKEIEATRSLLETIGKLDGKIVDGGRRSTTEEPDVLENLNKVKRDQVTRDRLHTQVKQLVEQSA